MVVCVEGPGFDPTERGTTTEDEFADPHGVTMAATRPSQTGVPATRIGRFVVIGELGRGGMGVVYSAYDPTLERKVAIKVIRTGPGGANDRDRARFEREAQAMARLSHRNVAQVFDVGTADGRLYIAMELVVGTTLDTWLTEHPKASPREVLSLYISAGQGLVAAHAAGIVHRDFKPGNVIVSEAGRVVVLDFGLARGADEPTEVDPTEADPDDARATEPRPQPVGVNVTETGLAVGTPAYMAPEQLQAKPADARSDQFSYCAALFEGLYGVRPLARDSPLELVEAMQSSTVREPPPGRRAPPRVHAAILRGLRHDPVERFETMERLLAVLQADSGRRRIWRLSLAAGALVGAVALGRWIEDRSTSSPCESLATRMDEVWGSDRRSVVRASVFATDHPDALPLWKEVSSELDGYAEHWKQLATRSCAATYQQGTQSEALHQAHMVCLDRALIELDGVGAAYTAVTRETIDHADLALWSLPGLEGCERAAQRVAATSSRTPADHDLALEIARTDAQAHMGAHDRAGRSARALLERPELGGATRARVLRVLAASEQSEGRLDVAATHLHEATELALTAGDDVEFAVGALALVKLEGIVRGRPELAKTWGRLGLAALQRVGGVPRLQSDFHNAIGSVHMRATELAQAETHLRKGLQLAQQMWGEEHFHTAQSRTNLGRMEMLRGRAREALGWLEPAHEIQARILDEGHPQTWPTLSTIAAAQAMLGQLRAADPTAVMLIDFVTRRESERALQLASPLASRATVAVDEGRDEDAAALLETVQDLYREHQAPLDRAATLTTLAPVLARLGRTDTARDFAEQALVLVSRRDPTTHTHRTAAVLARAEVRIAAQDLTGARADLVEARRMLGPEPEVGTHASRALRLLSRLAVAEGALEMGRQHLDEAMALALDEDIHWREVVETLLDRAELARQTGDDAFARSLLSRVPTLLDGRDPTRWHAVLERQRAALAAPGEQAPGEPAHSRPPTAPP